MAGVFLLQITVKNHEEDDHADGNQGQTADQNGNRPIIVFAEKPAQQTDKTRNPKHDPDEETNQNHSLRKQHLPIHLDQSCFEVIDRVKK